MYNSIYPININYSNQYRKASDKNSAAQNSKDNQPQHQDSFPNGTKVAIDYTKGQINISQVLTDFRSTIVAINAPSDIQDEVSIYLNLVEKESHKENPSRDIIISNLRNASRISDDFIARSLNKPSKVVEGWIDALFLQKTEDEIMLERFSVSTLMGKNGLYYRVHDKKSGKIIECNVGELNQTIWKLLEV